MANLYCWSGATGTASGAIWANAKTTLAAALVTEVAGDTIFVAHDHVETTAGALTLTSNGTLANPTKVICVNRAGSVPPVSGDRRDTAQIEDHRPGRYHVERNDPLRRNHLHLGHWCVWHISFLGGTRTAVTLRQLFAADHCDGHG